MLIRKSDFRDHQAFCLSVAGHSRPTAMALMRGEPFECITFARVYAPNGVEFDCTVFQLTDLVDVEISDIVVEVLPDSTAVIFEVGNWRTARQLF